MQARGEFLAEARSDFAVVDLKCLRAQSLLRALSRYLQERDPASVLAAMWPLTTIVPIVARACGYKGRVVVSEHAILSRQYQGWGTLHRCGLKASAGLGYRLADACVGVSSGVARDMETLAGLNPGRVAVINNPIRPSVRPNEHALDEARNIWGRGGGPRVLTVGSFKAEKNHALLLAAFGRIANASARLMFVGRGDGERELRAQAESLGVTDRVIFAGFRADPSPFYATADLFVLSSDHEGFGNVLVEALSYGLPVVSTDCPSGPSEILEKGKWGRLVPVGDADALARAIDEALAAQVDREALKRRAADFAPEIAARKYLDLMGLA